MPDTGPAWRGHGADANLRCSHLVRNVSLAVTITLSEIMVCSQTSLHLWRQPGRGSLAKHLQVCLRVPGKRATPGGDTPDRPHLCHRHAGDWVCTWVVVKIMVPFWVP